MQLIKEQLKYKTKIPTHQLRQNFKKVILEENKFILRLQIQIKNVILDIF